MKLSPTFVIDNDIELMRNDTLAPQVRKDDAFPEAIEFLQWLRPAGPWVLIAIIPDTEITTTITTHDVNLVRRFLHAYEQRRNIYYSINPTRTPVSKKPSKIDIGAIEYLPADLDPKDDESPEAAKARYLEALKGFKPAAASLVDSGNGLQGLWRLAERIDIGRYQPVQKKDGDDLELAPEAATIVADVEARTAGLMNALSGKAGTQNIDRIFRLPGTINLPNKPKLEKGRIACPAKLICCNGATSKLEDFPPAPAQAAIKKTTTSLDWDAVAKHAGWLKSVADLPSDFNEKGKIIIAHEGSIQDLSVDLIEASLLEKAYSSNWSAVSFALAAIFKIDGRFTIEQIAAALMCPLKCNQHITRLKGASQRRAVERLLYRSYEPTVAQRAARTLRWREAKASGAPVPSLYNLRLAIAALGIECGYDTFHNKLLFGYRGDRVRHEIELMLGEVSDNGIIRLRQIMSEQFGIDMGDKATRDAVISLALDHCFDPVCDMLADAEAVWDGTARLDTWVTVYLKCEDTPLNRAIGRKVLIAAVRRARHPGCKFDNITVLESKEGWGKSSAWRVLAGDENFSDASILGHGAREVQEQLAETWIHENADLAGMRKAEVETVKVFASRQSDDARPAYGHFLKKQKRHSIEVGTTNNDEYLQSQTGNRRFWPLVVHEAIDIELLKQDRLQLWGEAATHEASGESITLDEKLWAAAGEEQEKRRVKDPWEEILANIPESVEIDQYRTEQIIHRELYCADGEQQKYRETVASADLLTFVLRVPVGQQETRHGMRLAAMMRLAGWGRTSNGKVSIEGKQVRGYFRLQPADKQELDPAAKPPWPTFGKK